MTRVKICGITNLEAGLAALDEAADYLGFVFYPPSPRILTIDAAGQLIADLRGSRPEGWQAVGVFVNEPVEVIRAALQRCQLDVIQLNGEEDVDYIRQIPAPVFKAVRIGGAAGDQPLPTAGAFGAQRLLVDASVPGRYGGTGVVYDWAQVRPVVADGFLAGGLTSENVRPALAAAHPWGVDVSSGVERGGEKRPELIRAFIQAIREADLSAGGP